MAELHVFPSMEAIHLKSVEWDERLQGESGDDEREGADRAPTPYLSSSTQRLAVVRPSARQRARGRSYRGTANLESMAALRLAEGGSVAR